MLIRNLRNPQDYQKAVMTQDELIRIAIENDANIASARMAMRKGEVAPLPIEDQRSKEELIKDEALQISDAQKNLVDLGFKFDEASAIINKIGIDGALIINSSYPVLKKMFLSTYNIKLATPAFFIDWFEKYSEELQASKGLTFGNAGKFDALTANINDLKAIMPSKNDFVRLRSKIEKTNDTLYRRLGTSKNDIMRLITEVKDAIPTEEALSQLSANNPENARIIQAIQDATATFPTKTQIDALVEKAVVNEAGVAELTKTLSGISKANLQELQMIRDEMGRLAFNFPAALPPIDLDNPPAPLIPTPAFNALSYDDKKSFLTQLKRAGILLSADEINRGKTARAEQMTEDYNRFLPEFIRRVFNQRMPLVRREGARGEEGGARADIAIPAGEAGIGKTGLGLNIYSRTRTPKIKIGKGLALVEEEPKYKEFGKYAIHWGQLVNNDILNVKYKSLGNVPSLKPKAISEIFKDFIIDTMETGKINQRIYNQIPDDEKKLFEKIAIGAGLMNHFKLKKIHINEDVEEINRFNLLKGEYLAGNNNSSIIKELRRLIVKFINEGRIHKSEGISLLMELSI